MCDGGGGHGGNCGAGGRQAATAETGQVRDSGDRPARSLLTIAQEHFGFLRGSLVLARPCAAARQQRRAILYQSSPLRRTLALDGTEATRHMHALDVSILCGFAARSSHNRRTSHHHYLSTVSSPPPSQSAGPLREPFRVPYDSFIMSIFANQSIGHPPPSNIGYPPPPPKPDMGPPPPANPTTERTDSVLCGRMVDASRVVQAMQCVVCVEPCQEAVITPCGHT